MEIVLRLRNSEMVAAPWKKIVEACLILAFMCSMYDDAIAGMGTYTEDFKVRQAHVTVSDGMLLAGRKHNIGDGADISEICGTVKNISGNLSGQVGVKNMEWNLTKSLRMTAGVQTADEPDIAEESVETVYSETDNHSLENSLPETLYLQEIEDQKAEQSRQENITIEDSGDKPALSDDGNLTEENNAMMEIAGFCIDKQGYITGTTEGFSIVDGILLIAADEKCVGIRKGAFAGIEEDVMEVFIPENICEIESGALEDLALLMYIEVDKGNSCFYSIDGILYSNSNEIIMCPMGR